MKSGGEVPEAPAASILRSQAADSSKMSAYLPDYIASHPLYCV